MPPTTINGTAPQSTPKKVLSAIHNLPKRMRGGTLRGGQAPPVPARRPQGKENVPPGAQPQTQPAAQPPRPPRPSMHMPRRRRPAPLLPKSSTHAAGLLRDLDTPSPSGSTAAPASGPGSDLPPLSPLARALTLVNTALPGTGTGTGNAEPWAARGGMIVIKVWVPSTDDIWKVRVAAGIGLAAFRARVVAKLGFEVSFAAVSAGRLRSVMDEEGFKRWVEGRVRDGRNTLLTAHRVGLL